MLAVVIGRVPRGPPRCGPGRIVKLALSEDETGPWPIAYVATAAGTRLVRLWRNHDFMTGQEVAVQTTPLLLGVSSHIRWSCDPASQNRT